MNLSSNSDISSIDNSNGGCKKNPKYMSISETNTRRHHMRLIKEFKSNGHEFISRYFRQPSYCSFCSELLWGFNKKGLECRLCGCVVHVKCSDKLLSKCEQNHEIHLENQHQRFKIDLPHKFRQKNMMSLTFCDHCGHLIAFKRAYKCEDCGFNCHKTCTQNAPKNCGINQKHFFRILTETLRDSSKSKSDGRCGIMQISEEDKPLPIIDVVRKDSIDHDSTRIVNDKKSKMVEFEDFDLKRLVSAGKFGKVYLVKSKFTQNYFALKAVKKNDVLQADDVESIMLERDFNRLGRLNPFLTRLYCTFQNEEFLFFLMEFLNGGDLWCHIIESKTFPEIRVQFYTAEILSGLRFLHSENIVYRDLKLENVLLDSEGHCKIADFGMCKQLPKSGKTRTFCGTPDYVAPEIIRGEKYDFSVDYWSLGVLVYEMLVGYSPFYGKTEDDLFESILSHPVTFPGMISSQSQSFINKILERDPPKRLGMRTSPYGDICKHEFFASIDWEKLERCELEPPFKPILSSPEDLSYFDTRFTSTQARLSSNETKLSKKSNESIFSGFSFIEEGFNIKD